MQYVILTYMKHLGVKVKEPRNLEQKRGRIGFLPKIKVLLGVATEDLCAIQTPILQEKVKNCCDFPLFQEVLGLLSCTANLRAEIGFCVCLAGT